MNPGRDESAAKEAPKVFATTHWSVITAAGTEHSPAAASALEKLCRTYWFPVYGEIRRRGHAPHDAQDLTQEFFACLLRRNSFSHAEKNKGRFRSYLIGALNYFLADERERQKAEKRGGRHQIISLDQEEAEGRYREEPAVSELPEAVFYRRWKSALMEEALLRLKLEYTGKERLFEKLKEFLGAEVAVGGYEHLARELTTTPSALAVAVHRMRQKYAELVRAMVAETLANPAEVEDELRQIFG